MTRSHQSSAGSTQWVVPLSDVRVDRELREAVQAVVDSGWWSMGARVEAFERAFAEFCGVRHALGVANGTAALHLALLAAGCGPGDEVVLPSLNFVAAANAIVHTGATPVFCDVLGEQDLNLDPDDVEAAIGPATKAVLPLHYGGYACDMHAVSRLAERYDLRIVEDAAVGEGGMLVTNDDVLADRLRLLRSHGMTALTWGSSPGARPLVRRRRARLQLSTRRDPRRDGPRPAPAAPGGECGARPDLSFLPHRARWAARSVDAVRRR